jgi:hypothetical protein
VAIVLKPANCTRRYRTSEKEPSLESAPHVCLNVRWHWPMADLAVAPVYVLTAGLPFRCVSTRGSSADCRVIERKLGQDLRLDPRATLSMSGVRAKCTPMAIRPPTMEDRSSVASGAGFCVFGLAGYPPTSRRRAAHGSRLPAIPSVLRSKLSGVRRVPIGGRAALATASAALSEVRVMSN